MLDVIKNQLQRKKYVKMLGFVVGGTATAGLAWLPKAEADKLVGFAPEYVTLDATKKKDVDDGTVAVVATPKGIADFAAYNAAPAAVETPAAKVEITLESGIPIPEQVRGGGRREETYPFSKMEVGQSFFIANTEAKPNQAKSFASAVSGANKRFKDQGKTFTIRAVEGGARVWRKS